MNPESSKPTTRGRKEREKEEEREINGVGGWKRDRMRPERIYPKDKNVS